MEPIQPTIVYQQPAVTSPAGQSSIDTSKAHVDFVAGDRPRFSDETADLQP